MTKGHQWEASEPNKNARTHHLENGLELRVGVGLSSRIGVRIEAIDGGLLSRVKCGRLWGARSVVCPLRPRATPGQPLTEFAESYSLRLVSGEEEESKLAHGDEAVDAVSHLLC